MFASSDLSVNLVIVYSSELTITALEEGLPVLASTVVNSGMF